MLFPYAHDPNLLSKDFYDNKLLKFGEALNNRWKGLKLPASSLGSSFDA